MINEVLTLPSKILDREWPTNPNDYLKEELEKCGFVPNWMQLSSDKGMYLLIKELNLAQPTSGPIQGEILVSGHVLRYFYRSYDGRSTDYVTLKSKYNQDVLLDLSSRMFDKTVSYNEKREITKGRAISVSDWSIKVYKNPTEIVEW